MSQSEAIEVAREIVQQVTNIQVDIADHEDELTVHAEDLEEIVLRVLKDFDHVEDRGQG